MTPEYRQALENERIQKEKMERYTNDLKRKNDREIAQQQYKSRLHEYITPTLEVESLGKPNQSTEKIIYETVQDKPDTFWNKIKKYLAL